MPTAGSNKRGFWMQVIDGKLVNLSPRGDEYTGVCELDFDRAVSRLLAGEKVHVYSTYPFPVKVRETVEAALGSGAA